jgi:hypothetical protein
MAAFVVPFAIAVKIPGLGKSPLEFRERVMVEKPHYGKPLQLYEQVTVFFATAIPPF